MSGALPVDAFSGLSDHVNCGLGTDHVEDLILCILLDREQMCTILKNVTNCFLQMLEIKRSKYYYYSITVTVVF